MQGRAYDDLHRDGHDDRELHGKGDERQDQWEDRKQEDNQDRPHGEVIRAHRAVASATDVTQVRYPALHELIEHRDGELDLAPARREDERLLEQAIANRP